MLSIVVIFALALAAGYEVLIVGNHDTAINSIFYIVVGIMANSLGFSFGHSNALSAMQAGSDLAAAASAATSATSVAQTLAAQQQSAAGGVTP